MSVQCSTSKYGLGTEEETKLTGDEGCPEAGAKFLHFVCDGRRAHFAVSPLHHFAGRDFGMAWGRRLLQTAVRFTCGCHILEALADVGTGTAAEAFVAGTLFSKVVEH